MTDTKVFRGLTQDELDAHYDQNTFVGNLAPYLEQWGELTDKAMAQYAVQRDVRYGDQPKQRMDYFSAGVADAPLVLFFHGGAWMRHTKAMFGYPALAFVANGYAFATVEFDVVPNVGLDEQINHGLLAFEWLVTNAEGFDFDPSRVFVSGHHSGALLAGMVATTDWTERLKSESSPLAGALLLSGVYDLEPVRLSSRNEQLGLSIKQARSLSPIHQIPETPCPIVVAWGESESDEFRRQSLDFAAAWRRASGACSATELPGANHFDMSLELCDPSGPIIQAFRALTGDNEQASTAG
ncbi:MAG: alpha/beta hydrolase [Chromatiales bacterium]|nr:alpha/beta hydrolase [Chromatiales bacterium]